MYTTFNGTSVWVNGYSEMNDQGKICFLLRLASDPTAGTYTFTIRF